MKNQLGISLLEVAVALLIASIGLSSIFILQGNIISSYDNNRQKMFGYQIAIQYLELAKEEYILGEVQFNDFYENIYFSKNERRGNIEYKIDVEYEVLPIEEDIRDSLVNEDLVKLYVTVTWENNIQRKIKLISYVTKREAK